MTGPTPNGTATARTAWNAALDGPFQSVSGPAFDQPPGPPARRRLILCAGPRTASNMLANCLAAAGVGIPSEYFLPAFEAKLCRRWGLPRPHGRPARVEAYLDALLARRAMQGVFATKLQFWQFHRSLCNAAGRRLFDGATVVFLVREDVRGQVVSLAVAHQTGAWQDNEARGDRRGSPRRRLGLALAEALREDANFRRLFALSGQVPLLLTDREVRDDIAGAVGRVAALTGAHVHADSLAAMIAARGKYREGKELNDSYRNLAARTLDPLAFDAGSYRARPLGRLRDRLERLTGR